MMNEICAGLSIIARHPFAPHPGNPVFAHNLRLNCNAWG